MSETTHTMTAPPVTQHQSADPTQEPRRRAPRCGSFTVAGNRWNWRGSDVLAVMCEKAELTENEALAVLLNVVMEKDAGEIAAVFQAMGRGRMLRKHVWRLLNRAGRKMLLIWAALEGALRAYEEAEAEDLKDIVKFQKNSQGSSRTPLYMQASPGHYRQVSAPVLVDWRDLARLNKSLLALLAADRGKLPATTAASV